MQQYTTCPGCKLILPYSNDAYVGKFNHSAECWTLYHDLSAYTLSQGETEFIHQYIVDAYAAQHSGANVRAITTTFALIGLYLAIERGFTGRQVQRAHMLLAKHPNNWPSFVPPTEGGKVTVRDALTSAPSNLNSAIREWASSVWGSWESNHDQVAHLVKRYLD